MNQTPRLIAWHGDPALQKAVVAELAAHRKADALVQGYGYWHDGKGCAVGCLIKSGNHAEYEPRFGIPQALAHLEDTIFEGLPKADAQRWPERFAKAAKPGADLSLVPWKFLEFVVAEALSRPEAESVREACLPALEIVRAKARGEDVSTDAAMSAASAAWGAARSAASAARSAASAAWVTDSADYAARGVDYAARSAAWKRYADTLIDLMKVAA